MSCGIARDASSVICAGIAIIPAFNTDLCGGVSVPAKIASIIAKQLRNIIEGVASRAGPGLVVHVAKLHLRKYVWSNRCIANEP